MNQFAIDTLFINGKIYTMKEENDQVEAIGVYKGRIVFAGKRSESERYSPKEIIDLRGKTMIPGLGDSHLHLYACCQNQATVRLDDTKSMDEMIAAMKQRAAVTEKGKWIKGTGFDHTKFEENRMPTRWDLDQISTEHPIVIRRCCLHVMVANSFAILLAAIDAKKRKEFEGLIESEGDGTFNGIFREKATSIFDEIVPNPLSDPAERNRIFFSVLADMASKGITQVHTYAAKIWNYEESLETYQTLDRNGELPIRVVVNLDELFEPVDYGRQTELKNPYHKVKRGAYKLFTDGSLGARSAALTEPYSDEEHNYGILIDREKLIDQLQHAYEKRLQPAIHAIGDRALDLTLDAIEAVLAPQSESAGTGQQELWEREHRLPIRIIHAQMVRKDQLERLKKLPVVLDVQPVFLCTDLYWIESRLGKNRIKTAYLWKTLMQHGLILAGGSDCPVESYDPIKGIYAAVTRKDLNGFPQEGWEPGERLTVYEAICLFTKNIAYATGDEDSLGTIAVSKFADLTVLEEDPFRADPDRLKDVRVAMTFVAGEKVYDREGKAGTK
ncbi:MAG: amidohydrolase [Eubacteriales bacterium]|nr:amidohydrolase [Eubacteriales bacterium]